MSDIENFLIAWITIFALILFIVSIITYKRAKHPRLAIICAAFALFFIKGILLTWGLVNDDLHEPYILNLNIVLDSIILLFLAVSILKK